MAVTRTPTIDNPGAVHVSVGAGQFLHFILDAGGPVPIFSFSSDVKGVLKQGGPFNAAAQYQWDHLKNPSDIQQLEQLNLILSFVTNATYTYTVELRTAAGVVATVMEIDYAGTPTDVMPGESFNVVIV